MLYTQLAGSGLANSITGSSVTYAGGGAGTGSISGVRKPGIGGTGGGGNGDNGIGTTNLGGGGGGGDATNSGAGRAGGSGVVILKLNS